MPSHIRYRKMLSAYSYLAAGNALRGVGHAVLGWAVILPFIVVGLTILLKPVLTLLQKRYARDPLLRAYSRTMQLKAARRVNARHSADWSRM